MTIANKITVFRIILVPLFVFFSLNKNLRWGIVAALAVFLLASYTDYLDGKLARKKTQVTNFGEFLDPLADKILVMAAFVCFVKLGYVGAVSVIIILFREFLVTSIRLMAVKSQKVIAASIWGKAKTVSQIVAVIVILLLRIIEVFLKSKVPGAAVISSVFMWISVAFSLISGYLYVKDNIEYIK